MEFPSKELISIVLGLEIVGVNKVGNRIENTTALFPSNTSHINIYEFISMMKDYIKSKNLMLIVYHHLDTVAVKLIQNQKSIYASPGMSVYNEFEALKESCEWILSETKNN